MQRGSDKHGPVKDEALKQQVEPLERGAPVSPRVGEYREPEPSGDGEPESDARLTMTAEEFRSMIARYESRGAFPSDRDGLLEEAARNGAPVEVVAAIRRLPAGVSYATVQEVWRALGGTTEVRF